MLSIPEKILTSLCQPLELSDACLVSLSSGSHLLQLMETSMETSHEGTLVISNVLLAHQLALV